MSAPRKLTARDELDHIEDSLVETILNATGEELRADIKSAGGDPGRCIAEIASVVDRARESSARKALETARTELAAWRSRKGSATAVDRDAARARFEKIRSGDPALTSKMTIAARKGEGLSDSDFDGLLEDIAELERLERQDGEE